MTTLSSRADAKVHSTPTGLSRRRFLQLGAAGAAVAATAAYLPGRDARAAPAGGVDLSGDKVAQTFYRVLLKHTRWAETQWDASAGHYVVTDFSFAVVLGNAVLLTRGDYDADAAGIDADTLRAHTVATLTHFAASNRLTGGTEWGKTLFFDTTFQLYFQLAGRLLWDDLDAATRANLDTIAAAQAAYTTTLGPADDPMSPGWTPHGFTGGYVGDTKLEEMGVYAQSLAPGLAWTPTHAGADDWRALFGRWSRNETGLPQADLANPTVIDGVPVSDNTARNLYDTFLVENHGSFGPHYQCELWRTSGRNSIHFLTAGQPLPEVLTNQPNGEQLWHSILGVMSDAGEPLMPMVNDREHLYGRDVIPVAFLAQVLGDRRAAFAEAALADRLEAYQAYPPEYRITKFSGEPKYEPEARAEVAISYLLHEWRARSAKPVAPLGADAFYRAAAQVTDFGTGPGLVSHQSRAAWAGAVTKPGFVKFAWQPQHDDWLFALSGATPMFLPTTSGTVQSRSVRTYEQVRDGFDGSVTVVGLASGTAAFATLPGGSVVYATTGTGADEGHLELFNLTMPGVPGLDGDRTYTAAESSAVVPSTDSVTTTPPGVTRVDTLTFPAVTTRWIRMLGITPAPTYGYSIFELEARDGADGTNAAKGRPTTATSADTGHAAALATDGDTTTRWAVSRGDRLRADSSLAVDLGAGTRVDRASVLWEAAAGRAYAIQVSDDGAAWTTVASYPHPDLTSTAGWLSVDDRAGLVVRGSSNPITVTGDIVTLSAGPATGSAHLVVEGYPGLGAAATAAHAANAAPSAPTLRTSLAEHSLTLLNLGADDVAEPVAIPQRRTRLLLFRGHQTVTARGSDLAASVPGRDGQILAAVFTLSGMSDSAAVPEGVHASVVDDRTVEIWGGQGQVRLTSAQTGSSQVVTLSKQHQAIAFRDAAAHPGNDLALGSNTFPTTPLPPGMSAPAQAVDGDPHTAWTPGPAGRMVVDLGEARAVGRVRLDWTSTRRPAVRLETSLDGLTYTPAASLTSAQDTADLAVTARYLAVSAPQWMVRDASLQALVVRPG